MTRKGAARCRSCIDWPEYIFKRNIAGIPDDLFDTVRADDDDGRAHPRIRLLARVRQLLCTGSRSACEVAENYVNTKYTKESQQRKKESFH